jgi:hypothetical protein
MGDECTCAQCQRVTGRTGVVSYSGSYFLSSPGGEYKVPLRAPVAADAQPALSGEPSYETSFGRPGLIVRLTVRRFVREGRDAARRRFPSARGAGR